MSKHTRIKHQIEQHPLGATAATALVVEEALRAARSPHHAMPLAIALQFYPGDQGAALRLARFLADLEPERRDDVLLIFAARFDVEMGRGNVELWDALAYCSNKFPVAPLRSARRVTGYPDGCFGLWAGIAQACYERYCTRWPYHSVFFIEPDGVPLRWDWIDTLKQAHAMNLAQGKRITGARMGAHWQHTNGVLVMHLSCWADHPSLHTCAPGQAWDLFHSQVLLSELGDVQGISSLYGAQSIGESVFRTLGNEYHHAWLANTKDDSAWGCAQTLLPQTAQRRARKRAGSERSEE
ncbi:MAG TPA: hypothetical protein VJ860_20215 [Polyangia bacterium]|jgi:hypothetical protein|nr:hypothetical protein [Polyangia bacterium]